MTRVLPPVPLEGLRFKGSRDYLHGTDILPLSLRVLRGVSREDSVQAVDISFHGLARTGLSLASVAPPDAEPRAQLHCKIDGAPCKVVLFEDGREIAARQPYPEEDIVAACNIDAVAKTAASSGPLPFTAIERWIAMTKGLHQRVYPDAAGKWLFVRAKLSTYRDAYAEPGEHLVSIEADFGGKLTRNALTVDGARLGDIYFALA